MAEGKIISNKTETIYHFHNSQFENQLFTEYMNRSRGHYTDQHAQRCCKMTGGLGKQLDRIYSHKFAETYVHKGHKKRKDIHREVDKFVDEYLPDNLFNNITGRQHAGFPHFTRQHKFDMQDLEAKIKTNCIILDMHLHAPAR